MTNFKIKCRQRVKIKVSKYNFYLIYLKPGDKVQNNWQFDCYTFSITFRNEMSLWITFFIKLASLPLIVCKKICLNSYSQLFHIIFINKCNISPIIIYPGIIVYNAPETKFIVIILKILYVLER